MLPWQNFVIKTFIFGFMWSIFALYLDETPSSAWRSFWQGMFPVLNILLYASQVYAVSISLIDWLLSVVTLQLT